VAPTWNREPLRDKRIVIFWEQGHGDIVQIVRYLHSLKELGARVTFLAPRNLQRLLRPLAGEVELTSALDGTRAFDFQCPLMSLPLKFETDLGSIPNSVPYLRAEPELVAGWREKIGQAGFKIGICWQGNPIAKVDRGRSVPLVQFAPLAPLPEVRLISLQKHHGLDQLDRLPADVKVETLGEDFDAGADAFVDTAAVMMSLDLVVTSDTAMPHLAGALARPTWVALKSARPGWRSSTCRTGAGSSSATTARGIRACGCSGSPSAAIGTRCSRASPRTCARSSPRARADARPRAG
jgi:hypothetical protein